jgi:hypothetical protein
MLMLQRVLQEPSSLSRVLVETNDDVMCFIEANDARQYESLSIHE